ncbi:hypothetical protein SALBM311S_08078 [Streptomyces alboniger]
MFDAEGLLLLTGHPTRAVGRAGRAAARLGTRRCLTRCGCGPPPASEPLRAAGRLGTVLFQFPPWFRPGARRRRSWRSAHSGRPAGRRGVPDPRWCLHEERTEATLRAAGPSRFHGRRRRHGTELRAARHPGHHTASVGCAVPRPQCRLGNRQQGRDPLPARLLRRRNRGADTPGHGPSPSGWTQCTSCSTTALARAAPRRRELRPACSGRRPRQEVSGPPRKASPVTALTRDPASAPRSPWSMSETRTVTFIIQSRATGSSGIRAPVAALVGEVGLDRTDVPGGERRRRDGVPGRWTGHRRGRRPRLRRVRGPAAREEATLRLAVAAGSSRRRGDGRRRTRWGPRPPAWTARSAAPRRPRGRAGGAGEHGRQHQHDDPATSTKGAADGAAGVLGGGLGFPGLRHRAFPARSDPPVRTLSRYHRLRLDLRRHLGCDVRFRRPSTATAPPPSTAAPPREFEGQQAPVRRR